MKVILRWIHELGIGKARVSVVPTGLDVVGESAVADGVPPPVAGLRAGSTIVKVVVDRYSRRLTIRRPRLARCHEAAAPRIHDVVLKYIVCHVELHLELAGSRVRRIVSIKGVVDDGAVFGGAALGAIAADRNAGGIAGIYQVVASGDIAGGAAAMLARKFDPKSTL